MARMQIAQMSFAKVYPLLVQKAERKGRTKEEIDQVLFWLTGYDAAGRSLKRTPPTSSSSRRRRGSTPIVPLSPVKSAA